MPKEVDRSMHDVDRVLSSVGISRFSPEQISTISSDYRSALLNGLQGKSELPMYQSYLHPIDVSRLPQGKKALIVEIGGTNIYGAYLEAINGKMAITGEPHKSPLSTSKYESRDQFYGAVIDGLSPLLEAGDKPDALTIVYSFPGRSIPQQVGVDMEPVEKLTKEFVIPGISDELVSAAFKRVASSQYATFNNLPSVVLNDTVAVALSTGSIIGGVVGTGFNLSVDTPEGIISTESGAFKSFPKSAAFDAIDAETINPGSQTSEKRISGLYLPRYYTYGIQALNKEGILVSEREVQDSSVLSEILSKEPANAAEENEARVARAVTDQSAQIVGLMIGTLIDTFHKDHNGVISVPIEGSTQWGLPGYVDLVTSTAREISNKIIVIENVPNAGRLGAGAAALGTLLQK